MKQATFEGLAFAAKKKRTRREKFLAEMGAVVPWAALEGVIEPHYPKAGRRGGPPKALGAMRRIYFMQQWYALSDPGMEDALYEIESMRRFAGLELLDDALPDETTILNFRRLLETHQLTGRMMNVINDVLEDRGLLLKGGTMVDATIIHAPPSTKNRAKARDPDMHQTKKGKQYQAGGSPGRGLLGGSPEGEHAAPAERGEHTHQPALVADPQPGGAHLSGDQAPVWLHPGALPGSGQERCPGLHTDRADKSLPRAQAFAGMTG